MPRQGTTTERGYDAEHKRIREHMRPHVQAGRCWCWRCGKRIWPGTAWDVGHDDYDRTIIRGPEHASCNRAAPHNKHKRPVEPHPNRRRTRT